MESRLSPIRAMDAGEDRNRGIPPIRPGVDEIRFRNRGTENYMRMNGHQRP
jgi:hypothetical protein